MGGRLVVFVAQMHTRLLDPQLETPASEWPLLLTALLALP